MAQYRTRESGGANVVVPEALTPFGSPKKNGEPWSETADSHKSKLIVGCLFDMRNLITSQVVSLTYPGNNLIYGRHIGILDWPNKHL